MSLLSLVSSMEGINVATLDEVKWAVRAPSRYAMRSPKLTYLERVQEEINNFLKTNIKHDYLKPDRELSLDLTVKEAEILASANADAIAMADRGDLKSLHEKVRSLEE